MDFARLAFSVSVDKDGAPAFAKRFGKFRRKLMAGNDFNVLAGKRFSQQSAGVPPQRVITP
jgi:hypothetical protein